MSVITTPSPPRRKTAWAHSASRAVSTDVYPPCWRAIDSTRQMTGSSSTTKIRPSEISSGGGPADEVSISAIVGLESGMAGMRPPPAGSARHHCLRRGLILSITGAPIYQTTALGRRPQEASKPAQSGWVGPRRDPRPIRGSGLGRDEAAGCRAGSPDPAVSPREAGFGLLRQGFGGHGGPALQGRTGQSSDLRATSAPTA